MTNPRKLNVIVPYRDRPEHKTKFIEEMNQYLRSIDIDHFEIYIVEQDDDRDFNKGSLCNIGFLESNQGSNYYCFNDVDTIAKSKELKFGCPKLNSIYHPYGHKHCLSNLFIINSADYEKMNGFSSQYWSWGWEDTDILHRAVINGIDIDHSDFTERFKSTMVHELDTQDVNDLSVKMDKETTAINEILFYYSVLYPEVVQLHGLSNTHYSISSKVKYDTHTHIMCKLKLENNSQKRLDRFSNYVDRLSGYYNPEEEE